MRRSGDRFCSLTEAKSIRRCCPVVPRSKCSSSGSSLELGAVRRGAARRLRLLLCMTPQAGHQHHIINNNNLVAVLYLVSARLQPQMTMFILETLPRCHQGRLIIQSWTTSAESQQ